MLLYLALPSPNVPHHCPPSPTQPWLSRACPTLPHSSLVLSLHWRPPRGCLVPNSINKLHSALYSQHKQRSLRLLPLLWLKPLSNTLSGYLLNTSLTSPALPALCRQADPCMKVGLFSHTPVLLRLAPKGSLNPAISSYLPGTHQTPRPHGRVHHQAARPSPIPNLDCHSQLLIARKS